MVPSSSSSTLKKRHRTGSSGRLDSTPTPLPSIPGGFNDPSTSDVLLRLTPDQTTPASPFAPSTPPPSPLPSPLDLHLHSSALLISPYFSALLSPRWPHTPTLTLKVPLSSHPFRAHLAVLQLFYTLDFNSSLVSVGSALDILFVALELLFDSCVRACVKFLESVPWTEDEERLIRIAVPLVQHTGLADDLIARISPIEPSLGFDSCSEEMLHQLTLNAIHSHPTVATVKAFVARLMRDFSPRDSVKVVLDRVFTESLEKVKGLLAEYGSPDFRVSADNEETEAMQRLKLHAAVVEMRKLLWLVERVIELRVGALAVTEWSEQGALAVDLQKAFRDEAWRNIAPGLPALVMKCTGRLASALAGGVILADRQVRMKLVKVWLPVLNVCRDIISPIPSGQKILYQELEETFLSIISTLPMSDSCELLNQCLSFSTRNVEDCPHLISAFNTWFRRANQPPAEESMS